MKEMKPLTRREAIGIVKKKMHKEDRDYQISELTHIRRTAVVGFLINRFRINQEELE